MDIDIPGMGRVCFGVDMGFLLAERHDSLAGIAIPIAGRPKSDLETYFSVNLRLLSTAVRVDASSGWEDAGRE